MRNLLLALFLLTCLQAYTQKGFYIGFRGSGGAPFIVRQNTYGYTKLDPTLKIGYQGGILTGVNFTDYVGVFLGANYVKTGSSWDGTVMQVKTTRNIDMEYVQIPLYISYLDHEDGFFYVQAGPYLSLLLKANQTYTPASNPADIDPSTLRSRPDENGDIKNHFNTTDFGGTFRFGGCINLGDYLHLQIGAMVQGSLSDINHPDFHINDREGNYNSSKIYYTGIEIAINFNIN